MVNALICPLFTTKNSKDLSPKTTIFLAVFDLMAPFGIMLPYFEYTLVFEQTFSPSSFEAVLMLSLGVSFMVVGAIVMIVSRLMLGAFGRPTVVNSDQHELITKGTYRYIRHPNYSSMILIIGGYSLAFFSIGSTILFLIIIGPFIVYRIKAEENQLLELFGDKYLEYMKHTKRILPFIY